MRATGRMLVAAAGLVLALGALTAAHPTEAAWTDGEYAQATIASTILAAPAKGVCAANLASFTVNWTPSATIPAATGYLVTATNPSTGAVVGGPISLTPGTVSSYTSGTLLGSLIAGTYNINVVAVYQNWRSTPITWPVTVIVLGLLVSC
ncbi:hypothetical protein [Microbacterium sp. CJ88]|uniref:hypothetical protein n=1 Tax=Microbacterium sp. CJ88 TaxID=3445672 RepID=UPI003F65D1CD